MSGGEAVFADTAREGGALAENITHFARALRAAGLKVGPGSAHDAIEALRLAGIGQREDFYWTLFSVFVKRHEDTEIFEQAFTLFWRKRALMERMLQALMPIAPAPQRQQRDPVNRRVSDALLDTGKPQPIERPKPEVEIDASLTVSDMEVLRSKDFGQMSAREIAQARRAITELVLPFEKLKTRRLTASSRGRIIDMRRSIRASLRAGGMIALKKAEPKERLAPVVALCDISGSMSEYTQVFLHFLHALSEKRRVHSFVFGTRLTNITRTLRQKDPDEALKLAGGHVRDWAGGTRIAPCIDAFNRAWSRRVLGQGAVVLLITDGLERDADDGTLGKAMERLHMSCRRLIWLNPLLRYEGFEARARGIRQIMPHVDEFRSIHNIESMETLCRALDAPRGRDASPRKWLKQMAALVA